MRVTLDLDDGLLSAAQDRAKQKGMTVEEFLAEAVATAVGPLPIGGEPFLLRWRTHRGQLCVGVDIADRESLFNAMESRRLRT